MVERDRIDTPNTHNDPMNVFVYSLHLKVAEILCAIYKDMCSFVLCFCFVCLRLVCPMLPVSLDCPFLIASSAFSNVYLNYVQYIFLSFQTYD